MTDEAPLEAKVVARILRRAGEIELAGERPDAVCTIGEAALIAAADEVGLTVAAARRSIAIERLGPPPRARPGDRLLGPAHVWAEGEVAAPADDALVRVDAWMVDGITCVATRCDRVAGSGASAPAWSAQPCA